MPSAFDQFSSDTGTGAMGGGIGGGGLSTQEQKRITQAKRAEDLLSVTPEEENVFLDRNAPGRTLGDAPTEAFLRSVSRPSADPEAVTLGTHETAAVRDLGIGRAVARLDPQARALQDRGMQAIMGIDPGRMDQLSRLTGAQGRVTRGETAEDRQFAAQARARQAGALDQLNALAQGQDSVVAGQTQLAREQARRDISSRLASSRGGFSPAARRAALMAQGQASADIGAKGAVNQALERQEALRTLITGSQGLRAGDVSQQAQDVSAGAGQGNLLQLQGLLTGQADATRQGLFAAGDKRRSEAESNFLNQLLTRITNERQQPQGDGVGQAIGAALGGLGGIAAAFLGSDERMKEEVRPGEPELDSFLEALEPRQWRYKPGHEDGGAEQHIGVMAQALEKSEIGRRLVVKDDQGLRRVDYSPTKIGPLVLGSLAHLSKRIDKMEGQDNA